MIIRERDRHGWYYMYEKGKKYHYIVGDKESREAARAKAQLNKKVMEYG